MSSRTPWNIFIHHDTYGSRNEPVRVRRDQHYKHKFYRRANRSLSDGKSTLTILNKNDKAAVGKMILWPMHLLFYDAKELPSAEKILFF